MSTTFLFTGLGAASATPLPETFSFSSATDSQVDQDNVTTLTVGAGYCGIDWNLVGGVGGGDSGAGGLGGEAKELDFDQVLTGPETYHLYPGSAGENATTTGGAGGTSGLDDHSADGDHGAADSNGTDFGGGGGAGSAVTQDGGPVMEAPGGSGLADGGGAGGGHEIVPADAAHVFYDDNSGSGDGFISGTVHACDAPGSPSIDKLDGDDGSASVVFWPADTDDTIAPVTGWQYTTDAGTTWHALSATATGSDGKLTGTIPGLTNGHAYSVELRATSADNGPSDASDPESVTPQHTLAAPADVTATVGPSSLVVSWSPPVGETDISGYDVSVYPAGAQGGDGPGLGCHEVDAATRHCTVIAQAGQKYDVYVSGYNAAGWGHSVTLTSDVVPAPTAPATVPTGSGTLSTPTGAPSGLAQGSTVTLTGTGYAPNSTVSLYIYSTPTLLGTVRTDGTGSFRTTVTVPANLAPGAHHLVSAGVDPSGNPRYLTSAVTVAQATGTLAWTGFETLPVLLGGVLTVAVGAGLVLVGRRRRTA